MFALLVPSCCDKSETSCYHLVTRLMTVTVSKYKYISLGKEFAAKTQEKKGVQLLNLCPFIVQLSGNNDFTFMKILLVYY